AFGNGSRNLLLKQAHGIVSRTATKTLTSHSCSQLVSCLHAFAPDLRTNQISRLLCPCRTEPSVSSGYTASVCTLARQFIQKFGIDRIGINLDATLLEVVDGVIDSGIGKNLVRQPSELGNHRVDAFGQIHASDIASIPHELVISL